MLKPNIKIFYFISFKLHNLGRDTSKKRLNCNPPGPSNENQMKTDDIFVVLKSIYPRYHHGMFCFVILVKTNKSLSFLIAFLTVVTESLKEKNEHLKKKKFK